MTRAHAAWLTIFGRHSHVALINTAHDLTRALTPAESRSSGLH